MMTGDVLPLLKQGASCNQRLTPQTENVLGSIDISVMGSPTMTTSPFSYS